jgi:hypothetical protein
MVEQATGVAMACVCVCVSVWSAARECWRLDIKKKSLIQLRPTGEHHGV